MYFIFCTYLIFLNNYCYSVIICDIYNHIIYLLTSIYCIHNSLPYMLLFSYHLCISSMCCLIVYFIISCSFIIYSFHIFLYSYYSSIHIISYIHIYSYYLSNLYPSIQSGTARNPVPKFPIFSPKILGLNHTAYFGPENNLCHDFLFQVGKIPYLVEFDETPRFWYPSVAHDA